MTELDDDDYDRQQSRVAEDIDQARQAWMVMYGVSSRKFWAFRLFGRGGFFADADRRELERRMDAAEKEHRNRGRRR